MNKISTIIFFLFVYCLNLTISARASSQSGTPIPLHQGRTNPSVPSNSSRTLNRLIDSRTSRPLTDMAEDSLATEEYIDFDIGIIKNCLFYSEMLCKEYSGIGFVINLHYTEHLTLTYKRNYWQIKAINPQHSYTPFYSFQTPMNVMSLEFAFYYKRRSLFAHFGYAWTERKIGPHKWHGPVYGFGYRRPLHGNINLSIILDHRNMGRFGLVDGESWDVHSELGVEISYRMNIGELKKKIAKKLRNKEESK